MIPGRSCSGRTEGGGGTWCCCSTDSASPASLANQSIFPCDGKHPPPSPTKQRIWLVPKHRWDPRWQKAPLRTPSLAGHIPCPWLTEGSPQPPPSFRSVCHYGLTAFIRNVAQFSWWTFARQDEKKKIKCKRQAMTWLNFKWLSADCIIWITAILKNIFLQTFWKQFKIGKLTMLLTFFKILVRPLITRENLYLEMFMRHSLLCSVLTLVWVFCWPAFIGSYKRRYKHYKLFYIESYIFKMG